MDLQKTTIMLPPDLHKKLKIQAVKRGVSMGELLRQAIVDYLKPVKSNQRRGEKQ